VYSSQLTSVRKSIARFRYKLKIRQKHFVHERNYYAFPKKIMQIWTLNDSSNKEISFGRFFGIINLQIWGGSMNILKTLTTIYTITDNVFVFEWFIGLEVLRSDDHLPLHKSIISRIIKRILSEMLFTAIKALRLLNVSFKSQHCKTIIYVLIKYRFK